MRELVAAQLVQQIFPSMYIPEVPRFTDAFLSFVDHHPTVSRFRGRGTFRTTTRIHMEKLDRLADELVQRGLARQSREPAWFDVEPTTAHYFMTYLATLLGFVAEYQPVTDSPKGLSNLVSRPRAFPQIQPHRQLWRAKILDNLLPGPIELDDVDKLATFKDRHGQQLKRFRNHVEQFLLDLEAAPENQSDERILRFLADAKDQVSEISTRLREHRWQILGFGTLCTIASSLLPLIATAPRGDYLEAAGAGFGIISAIGTALSVQHLRDVQRHPLAYAVFIERSMNLKVHGSDGPTLYEIDDDQLLIKLLRNHPY